MDSKSLGGKGKWAIGLTLAGIVISGRNKRKALNQYNKPVEYEQPKTHSLPRTSNQQPQQSIDNEYAMQMAQDISSYRYGKRMTGFVNS